MKNKRRIFETTDRDGEVWIVTWEVNGDGYTSFIGFRLRDEKEVRT